jgi:HD-GYP domain-containing protein (c-di-GMP phosphodiesterase class II)
MSLGMGALLHDIGMVKLPLKITQKKGKLTETEYNLIRTHPLISYKLLSDSGKFTKDVCMIVLQHHERFDGKGYPRHIKGESILDLTKIVQITSVYQAMICKRTYREEFQYFDAMRHILNGCQGEFDPVYLKLFLSLMSYYPLGSYVKLSDNRVAEVTLSNPKLPMKPIVKIIVDAEGRPIREGERINLGVEAGIYIVKPMDNIKVDEIRARFNT